MKLHLSHSQFCLLDKNPKEYVKRYIFGETFSNAGMDFGKRFAEAIEKDEPTGDPIIDFGLIFMPRYDFQEFEIKIDGLLGYLDGYSESGICGEYKTGKTEWSQKKVDEASQITFYTLLVFKKYGIIPEAELHHLSPEMEITSFHTERTKKDLENLEKRIEKAQKLKLELHSAYEIGEDLLNIKKKSITI